MDQLGVFAKFWQPGEVKTRLAAHVGDAAASAIYRQFLDTLLQRLSGQAERSILAFWPAEQIDAFRSIASGWQLQPQSEGNLGTRMDRYFEDAFAAGCRRVVLLGSDSPNLPVEFVQQAFAQLGDHDVVLGPTFDGGYYLVGASRHAPNIFAGVSWSTPQVWEQTLDNARRAALRCATLPRWYDVDEIKDLQRLRTDLRDASDSSLLDLRAAIDRHAILPSGELPNE